VWVFNPHPTRRTFRVTTDILIPNTNGKRGPVPPVQALAAVDGTGTAIDVTVLDTEGDVMRNEYLEQTWGRRYRIAFEVEVPPLGYQLVHVHEDGPAPASPVVPSPDGRPSLENEHYRVTVDDGDIVLREKAQDRRIDDVIRFEYQMDAGDTYSFGPVPEHGPWWATLDAATPHPTRPNALRLRHTLTVPADYDRNEGPIGSTDLVLTTDLALGPHRALEIEVQYENTAENGRLRAVLPANATTRRALMDGHFRLAERTQPNPQTPESHPERYDAYPGELTYPTHHQGDFTLVEGDGHRTWLANRGLPEIELLHPDGDTHLAVSLHRAVDMLSVEGGRIRRCQAGPSMPTPGAQCLRPIQAELAYGTGAVSRAAAVGHARAFAHPAWAREMPVLPHVASRHRRSRSGSLLAIDNPAVELSTVAPAPADSTQTIRLWNRSGSPQDATLTLGFSADEWCPTDLHETWDSAATRPIPDSTIELTLGPHQIQTLLVR
jgi:mannosylglycerate hydrolase